MKLLLFIKNILKNTINTNNIVLFLELLRNINYIYIGTIVFYISLIVWLPFIINTVPRNESTIPLITPIIPLIASIIKMIPQIFFVIMYSMPVFVLVYIILKHKKLPKHVLTYSNIKGVSKFSNFLDYYYTLIPVCMVTTGIVLITLVTFHPYFFLAGAMLFFLGGYVFFMLRLLKITFYNMRTADIYNNITRANDIFTHYISSNKTGLRYVAIKEFTKNFKRVLDGIDFHFDALFDKRINIDSLRTKENITVKQLIIRYLPVYLSYCSETELNYFEIKLNSMVKLIDKENMITSLDIIKIVYSIHQDIATFLNQYSYVVPKNTLLANLIDNTKKRSSTFRDVFLAICIIIGLSKFLIPNEILNNGFTELFDYISAHNINLFAFILPFLATLPILYKFLKELNE